MANDHWPLFDLEIRTPRLTLRYLDDPLATELVEVARRGVHDPAVMPFTVPWTDLPSPQMEQEAMRFYSRNRAETRPASWTLQFAVIVDRSVIGACDLMASDFALTGLWHDNAASLGVTQSLGYEEEGRRRELRRGVPDEITGFRMSRAHWNTLRRSDVTLSGIDAARGFLGV
jgi:RimJ/RimL family protein N-acetyltransferase